MRNTSDGDGPPASPLGLPQHVLQHRRSHALSSIVTSPTINSSKTSTLFRIRGSRRALQECWHGQGRFHHSCRPKRQLDSRRKKAFPVDQRSSSRRRRSVCRGTLSAQHPCCWSLNRATGAVVGNSFPCSSPSSALPCLD